jgi:hypothetical protein
LAVGRWSFSGAWCLVLGASEWLPIFVLFNKMFIGYLSRYSKETKQLNANFLRQMPMTVRRATVNGSRC